MQEYNDRKNKKLTNNVLTTDRQMYWVTSSRPSNFGDPLETKTKVDNWFDENRVWNEENRDYEIRRAQIYMLQGFILGNYVLGVKTILTVIYHQMITRNRYIRDTYKEMDISELPPGEVAQTSWNGEMIFVRRLTKSEVDFTNSLPESTLIDKSSKTSVSPLATPQCFAALLSALTWAAFPCHIWELTRDGSACATVPCTISSVV